MLDVTFDIPKKILEGLQNNSLKRFGGVVRDSQSGRVVAFLSEAKNINALNIKFPPLLSPCLNTAGFAILIKQLENISQDLQEIKEILHKINKKIDFQQIAKLKAGIEQCNLGKTLKESSQKEFSSAIAINNLIESRHYFMLCAQQEAEEKSLIADKYISLVMVAYVAEMQTYLSLNEKEKAIDTLGKAKQDISQLISLLVSGLLVQTPVFLMSEFAGNITLEQIVNLQNWIDDCDESKSSASEVNEGRADASKIYEKFRVEMGSIMREGKEWYWKVPSLIVNKSEIDNWYFGPVAMGTHPGKLKKAAIDGAPKAFATVERLIEDYNRMTGFQEEIKVMKIIEHDIDKWSQMKALLEGEAACIILSETLQEQLQDLS